jgi:hypothetical protein
VLWQHVMAHLAWIHLPRNSIFLSWWPLFLFWWSVALTSTLRLTPLTICFGMNLVISPCSTLQVVGTIVSYNLNLRG